MFARTLHLTEACPRLIVVIIPFFLDYILHTFRFLTSLPVAAATPGLAGSFKAERLWFLKNLPN